MTESTIIEFRSRVDGTGPLFAEVFRPKADRNVPMAAVMAGFHGTRQNVLETAKRLASKGLCAVAVDMRGRGESAGAPDSGAVEIHDIMDALDATADRLGDGVDRNRCSIVGYSGGGGNVFSAITKFPDRFQVAAAFFGIADYAFWHRSRARVDCCRTMEKWIGGGPNALPEKYQARNSVLAAGNCVRTEVHIFWDEGERDCPGSMNERFAEAARHAGNESVHCHVSREGDKHRWIHGYPETNPDLIAAEEVFVPRMLDRHEDISLPSSGRLVVPGYVVTRRFAFWVGDGQAGTARIEYNLEPSLSVRLAT